jgi:hypothetical protein
LGSEVGSVLVSGMLVVCSRKKELTVWSEFVYVGQHCDGMIALGGLRTRERERERERERRKMHLQLGGGGGRGKNTLRFNKINY